MPNQPVPHRILKAKMAAKGLTVKALARKARMPETTVSQILSGHWIQPERLTRLSALIESHPGPRITVHA